MCMCMCVCVVVFCSVALWSLVWCVVWCWRGGGCTCVCVCVRLRVCVRACMRMHTYVRACACVCADACMCACVRAWVFELSHVCPCICTCMLALCACMCVIKSTIFVIFKQDITNYAYHINFSRMLCLYKGSTHTKNRQDFSSTSSSKRAWPVSSAMSFLIEWQCSFKTNTEYSFIYH